MVEADRLPPPSFEFSMAFQPVVDMHAGGKLFAYEALVRGPQGEGADTVFARILPENAVAFDAACRERALQMAASFGVRCRLCLNVSPSAIQHHRFGIHATLEAARRGGWPVRRLIFELTEQEPITDIGKLARWMAALRNRGVTIAVDDFGAGHAGLSNLLQLRPQMIKIDMALVRGIDADRSRQALVKGIVEACTAFNCAVIGEGVETEAEFLMLSGLGIGLMQGHLFAKPGFACLPEIIRPTSLPVNGKGTVPPVHAAPPQFLS